MEALLFFLFIIIVVSVVGYFLRKTSADARAELARKERQIQRARRQRAEKVATSVGVRLADKEEVWRERRRHVALASEPANKTVGTRYFKYKADEEPAYDGYSRSDRHRVTPGRIKKEGHLDEIVLPSAAPRRAVRPSQPQESR